METLSVANRFGLDHEWRGPCQIQGLPDHLKDVPRGAYGPDDPDLLKKQQAWDEWGAAIRKHRLETLLLCAKNPKFEAIELRRCANDPAYFIAMYGYLYEARTRNGRGGYREWIPFERQIQAVRWFQCCMAADDENADGVGTKCRDVGLSWLMVALFQWAWRFQFPFDGLFVSKTQDDVDSRSKKSLFAKFDTFMQYLPNFLKPNGYIAKFDQVQLYRRNPENGNTITGASTTSNAARGDRVTATLFDEAAQIPGLMDVWSSAADATDHRFAISTEHMDKGTDFSDLRSGVDSDYHPNVLTVDWYEHPLHDHKWYERQEKRYATDPDGFRREVLRDPYSQSQFVYPPMREKFPTPGLDYEPGNPLYVAIDPGFEDSAAIIWIQFSVARQQYEVLNGYTNDKMLADFYGPLLTGSYETIPQRQYDGKEIVEDLRSEFQYGPNEQQLIEWVESIGGAKAKFIGDTYGDNKNGASADTWYSVWNRRHGVQVNRDRLPSGKAPASKMEARTHTGRRKAVRWILPKLVFADSIGARKVLLAVQNNQFNRPVNGRISESGMFRDGTTHFTSALEYWAVNMYQQDMMHRAQSTLETRANERKHDELRTGPRWGRRTA